MTDTTIPRTGADVPVAAYGVHSEHAAGGVRNKHEIITSPRIYPFGYDPSHCV